MLGLIVKVLTFGDIVSKKDCTFSLGFQIFSGSQSYTPLPASQYYTVSQKKHVTTFSTITLTISVRLQ